MAITEAAGEIHPIAAPRPRAAPERRTQAAAEDLLSALRRRVAGEVRFDPGSRALYATDLSIYRQVPIGVVVPKNVEDVVETVAACHARSIPILGRGSGTSLAGQTCNLAVVIDFSKYLNRIIALDPDGKRAHVEPGLILDHLRNAAERHHLTFGPDPATHAYCTLGGMIGNNSCGVHSVMSGRTADNVEALEILTYDGLRMNVGATSPEEAALIESRGGRRGAIYRELRLLAGRYGEEVRRRFPRIPRRVSGYNLDELLPENGCNIARALVGSEGTCAIVLSATLRLVDSPPHRTLLVIGYSDIFRGADQVPELRGLGPIGLEGFHRHVVDNMRRKGRGPAGAKLLPEGDGWLIAEFGGASQGEAEAKARAAIARLERSRVPSGIRLVTDKAEQHAIWHIRESGVGASRIPGDEESWPSWEDAAVAPERLGAYLREFDGLVKRHGYRYTLFGHFGDGCIHTRITFDLKTAPGVARYRAFMEDAAALVIRHGGSLSGEHGDGQAKGELLPKMFGSRLVEAFREFKSIWDPHWRMNPGKLIDAYPLDENLRLGPDYRTTPVETWFKYPDDKGSFARATERCFGIGRCRSHEGWTMCPSFQATHEEMHTTRGRAHLLFEMLRGEAVTGLWRDEHVKEALALCLQCKGCKHDCPVSVDMATYKAEFLAHYYEGRLRPREAYAMGLVHLWAPFAARAPGLVNFLTHAPVLGAAVKRLAGFTQGREAPAFAPQTFRAWFAARPKPWSSPESKRLLLWPDTFNNFFTPKTAIAAVEVLEAAGWRVEIPETALCCGRPLYDYGMLDRAKRQLRQILDRLRPAIREGIPVVGLEPSCIAVFRDELLNLMPEDEDAQRLAGQSFLLGEFLARQKDYAPPRLAGKALVHAHCHQRAVLDPDGEPVVLERMGIEVEPLEAGCCGGAGSFGFEAAHYDVSMKIAERAFLPAVRKAATATIVLADGFSCRTQIAHGTERRALHLAEVMRMALAGERRPSPYPERGQAQEPARLSAPLTASILAGTLLAAAAIFWAARRRA